MNFLKLPIRAPGVWSSEWFTDFFRKALARPLSGIFDEPVQLPGYTVAQLADLDAVIGMEVYVTDATAPTWNTALTGGGAVVCKAFYNGSAWRAG